MRPRGVAGVRAPAIRCPVAMCPVTPTGLQVSTRAEGRGLSGGALLHVLGALWDVGDGALRRPHPNRLHAGHRFGDAGSADRHHCFQVALLQVISLSAEPRRYSPVGHGRNSIPGPAEYAPVGSSHHTTTRRSAAHRGPLRL
jgi:hypothetical protein